MNTNTSISSYGAFGAVDETTGVVFVAAAVAVDKERMLLVHASLVMAVMALKRG